MCKSFLSDNSVFQLNICLRSLHKALPLKNAPSMARIQSSLCDMLLVALETCTEYGHSAVKLCNWTSLSVLTAQEGGERLYPQLSVQTTVEDIFAVKPFVHFCVETRTCSHRLTHVPQCTTPVTVPLLQRVQHGLTFTQCMTPKYCLQV